MYNDLGNLTQVSTYDFTLSTTPADTPTVTAIYDINGNFKVRYLYDAWGNCTISSETTDTALANANPIRYRGYYDSNTGLYYLNARYYSPKWRRFISPDSTEYIDPESVNGLNLYCYCGNDPFASPFR